MKRRRFPEFQVLRARILPCNGCPTVDCTCMTELEEDLLKKAGELIKATGKGHITDALKWIRAQRKKGGPG